MKSPVICTEEASGAMKTNRVTTCCSSSSGCVAVAWGSVPSGALAGPRSDTRISAAAMAARASPPVAGLSWNVRGRRIQSKARFHNGSGIAAISFITAS